jgi:transcriptional regulator with XRE-family HTH domain
MEDFSYFAEWIKDHLERRGLTESSLARKSNYKVTATSLSKYRRDIRRPSPETMSVICETLSRLPIANENGPSHLEEVRLDEGLAAYAPKLIGAAAYHLKANSAPWKKTDNPRTQSS